VHWLAAVLAGAIVIGVEATTASATPPVSEPGSASPATITAPRPAALPTPSPTATIPATPRPTPTPSATPAPTGPAPLTLPPGTPVPTAWPVRRGDGGPLVLRVQQRLRWLGYPVRLSGVMDTLTVGAVTKFRAKFGLGGTPTVTAAAWTKLASLTRTRGALPASCLARDLVLCVDKTQKSLRLVQRGVVILTVDARFGGVRYPTREGVYSIYRKSRFHVSSLYRTSMPFAMFFSGGQAVHYSPYFDRDGYNGASHGCVNLRSYGTASRLFDRVPIGTRVVVYRS
jgi:hypothetical protein